MAFLDALTNVFTGKPAQEAATSQRNYLAGVQQQGNAAIDTGLGNARTALTTGYNTGRGDIGTGLDAAQGYLGKALGSYAPLSSLGSKYGAATTLGMNALGVNGPEGNAAANAAFQSSPGYQFLVNQGIDAINRRRAAAGGGADVQGGNADRDAINYVQGQAAQDYGNWRNALLGFTNPELAATSGAVGGQANVLGQQAQTEGQRAAMLSDLAQRYGTGTAGLETGAANQKVALATGLANPYANTYGEEAAAAAKGSNNLWNLGLGLAGLGTNLYGYSQGANKPLNSTAYGIT